MSGQEAHAAAVSWGIRLGRHDVWLGSGEFLIGRSAHCQIVLGGTLVSREHARLRIDGSGAQIEDLGSSNGVFVNGARLGTDPYRLEVGDRVSIGEEDLEILCSALEEPHDLAAPKEPEITHEGEGIEITELGEDPEDVVPTGTMDAIETVGKIALRAIESGREAEAEEMIRHHLAGVSEAVCGGQDVAAAAIEVATEVATALAAALKRGQWIDYVVRLHTLLYRPLPDSTALTLCAMARRADRIDAEAIGSYREMLRTTPGLAARNPRALQYASELVRIANG